MEEKTMKAFNRSLRFVAVLALLLGALAWSTNRTRASNPQPQPLLPGQRYGIVTIVSGEIAQLHVVNTAEPCPPGQPCDPIEVELSFTKADPNNPIPIGSPLVARLTPGQSAQLDFNPDTALGPGSAGGGNGKVGVRPLVISKGEAAMLNGTNPIVSDLEVMDKQDKVHVIYHPRM